LVLDTHSAAGSQVTYFFAVHILSILDMHKYPSSDLTYTQSPVKNIYLQMMINLMINKLIRNFQNHLHDDYFIQQTTDFCNSEVQLKEILL